MFAEEFPLRINGLNYVLSSGLALVAGTIYYDAGFSDLSQRGIEEQVALIFWQCAFWSVSTVYGAVVSYYSQQWLPVGGSMVYLQEEEDKEVEKPSHYLKTQSTAVTDTNDSVRENKPEGDISVDAVQEKKEGDASNHQSSEKSVESDAIHSNEECTRRENLKGIGILMLDIQNEFAKEGGMLHSSVAGVMESTGMLQKIPSVVAAARQVGATIIHAPTYMDVTKGTAYEDKSLLANNLIHRTQSDVGGLFIEGTWNSEIIDELKPEKTDHVLSGRTNFSAFDGTELQSIIEENSIAGLFLMGYLTNVCVQETAIVASRRFPDMEINILSDGCAAKTEEDQSNAFQHSLPLYANIMTCENAIKAIVASKDICAAISILENDSPAVSGMACEMWEYHIARLAISLLLSSIWPVFYALIIDSLTGICPTFGRTILCGVILALDAQVFESMGRALAELAGASRVAVGVAFASILSQTLVIAGGFYKTVATPVLAWISYVNGIKWGFTAIAILVFSHEKAYWVGNDGPLPIFGYTWSSIEFMGNFITFRERGVVIVDSQSPPKVTIPVLSLLGLILGFRVLCFLLARWHSRNDLTLVSPSESPSEADSTILDQSQSSLLQGRRGRRSSSIFDQALNNTRNSSSDTLEAKNIIIQKAKDQSIAIQQGHAQLKRRSSLYI